jgi:hypothetical protein
MKGLKSLEKKLLNEPDVQQRVELCREFIREHNNKDFMTPEWGTKYILRNGEEEKKP